MNIPARVRIKRNVGYEVLYADLIKNDPDCVGYCDPETRQIILKNGLSQTQLIKAFIHEVIHAICFERIPFRVPHKIVYLLEEGTYQVLKLNGFI
jgi:hypothetical protein